METTNLNQILKINTHRGRMLRHQKDFFGTWVFLGLVFSLIVFVQIVRLSSQINNHRGIYKNTGSRIALHSNSPLLIRTTPSLIQLSEAYSQTKEINLDLRSISAWQLYLTQKGKSTGLISFRERDNKIHQLEEGKKILIATGIGPKSTTSTLLFEGFDTKQGHDTSLDFELIGVF